jgi:hypothetical protein
MASPQATREAAMKRRTQHALAAGLTAASLALGAFAALDAPAPPAAVAPVEPTLLDTLTLLRWGYGALDWLIPHDNGEPHERKRQRRG